jgi:hypothetical protein
MASFLAYDPAFRGGVFVAAGDLDGNGTAEVITGAGVTGGPHVEVFNGMTGAIKTSFLAFDAGFRGGVRVAAADVNGDGRPEIVAGAGPGGGPQWRAFDAATLQPVAGAFAFDAGFVGGVSVAGAVSQPIAAQNADAVLQWNAIALNAIRADKTAPPKAARALAMVSAAVYDAVNAVIPLHTFYHANPGLHPNADPSAAAAAAAHSVLDSLFPAQAASFDALFNASMGKLAASAARDEGVALGNEVAGEILAWRANDGSGTTVPYTPGTAPGQWQPTPPANAPALLPQWPGVTPFAMTSGSQFRPAPPPPLVSQA